MTWPKKILAVCAMAMATTGAAAAPVMAEPNEDIAVTDLHQTVAPSDLHQTTAPQHGH